MEARAQFRSRHRIERGIDPFLKSEISPQLTAGRAAEVTFANRARLGARVEAGSPGLDFLQGQRERNRLGPLRLGRVSDAAGERERLLEIADQAPVGEFGAGGIDERVRVIVGVGDARRRACRFVHLKLQIDFRRPVPEPVEIAVAKLVVEGVGDLAFDPADDVRDQDIGLARSRP